MVEAGLSFANPSAVVSGSIPSSRATVRAFGPEPTVTGTTSASKAPLAQAAAKRRAGGPQARS